jgi:hypothetical protein
VITGVVDRWHRYLEAPSAEALGDLLADDVVFYSPVVFTPQQGKDVTMLYLLAAAQSLPGDGTERGSFHYTKQVLAGDVAVLEFETTVGGKHVNGVDIIRCDDAGRIVEFRVMIRPLQAVNAVHQQMAAMLESMQS